MDTTPPQPGQLYERGLEHLRADRPSEAAEDLRLAVRLERESGVPRPRMRFLSYYGLALALGEGVTPEAVRCCEVAVEKDRFDAILKVNLARVYRMSGRVGKALQVLDRGRRIHPDEPKMVSLMSRWDRRKAPLFSSLSRDHAINRIWGKLRRNGSGKHVSIDAAG
ncbi:MAG: hypothetical protein OEV00_06450 [Acidobacteriota bacterium]|nr:hypothetical protein [Acidobacteriota bacterium]MDH3784951.1 hypothetical protein [Acidobacteriota bacterium]